MRKWGKKSGDMGSLWWGCGSWMKDGVEMMGVGVVDVDGKSWMMVGGDESGCSGELKMGKMSVVED